MDWLYNILEVLAAAAFAMLVVTYLFGDSRRR